MSKSKVLTVFFDIETLQYNTGAKKPSDRKVIDYVCTMIYDDENGDKVMINFNSIKSMIDYLLKLNYKKFKLVAHNGGRYDFHFLRKTLIDYYGMNIKNKYQRNSDVHELQTVKKDLKGDYMLESRVKAKTNLDLDFKINGKEFLTEDSLPKFQASIATLGKLLFHHGIIEKQDEKLVYAYTRYDRKIDFSDLKARQYADLVYNNLSPYALKYVGNDTNILYLAYKHYNILFPGFDISKRSLSQNILNAYNKNNLSNIQLLNTYRFNVKKAEKLNYSDYEFGDRNLYDYVHRFYKGGLNVYNDRYVGKIVTDLVHFDLNSSYPYVMATEKVPTFINRGISEGEVVLDNEYYYMLEVTRKEFNNLLRQIKSSQIRKYLNKYFNNSYDCVYISTPHIELLEKFIGRPITKLNVKSGLEWNKEYFGARDILKNFYQKKTDAKKQGLSYGEIYVTKVCLNGIYGIPALRARFNLFEWNGHEYQNAINGFKNRERNIAFASSVTAYAIRNLLSPLANNVSGIDNGFVYADTDSIFCRSTYFNTIKDRTRFDKYELGAWDIEHDQIKKMVVLNHKKYCLLNKDDEIEVHCGGVPLDTFDLNMSFEQFVKTQFSDGVQMLVKKHSYTKTGTIAIYEAPTVLKQGAKYLKPDELNSRICYNMSMVVGNEKFTDIDDKGGVLYIETPYGSCSLNDLNPVEYETGKMDLNVLINKYKVFKKGLYNETN